VGYFNNLLRQTGMKIEGGGDQGENLAEDISARQHLADGIAPIEIEETLMIESHEKRVEDGADRPVSAESRSKAIKNSEQNDNCAGIHEHASLANASNNPEIEEAIIDERLVMEAQKAGADEMEMSRGLDNLRPPSRNDPAKRDRSAAVRRSATSPDISSNSMEFSDEEIHKKWQDADPARSKWKNQKEGVFRFPGEEAYQEQSENRENTARKLIAGMEIENFRPSPGSLASSERISHESSRINRGFPGDNDNLNQQILSAVKKEIRDWVIAESELTSEEDRTRVTEEMAGQVERDLPRALHEMQGPLEAPSMRRSSAREKGDAGIIQQHFHISIGPIHLSLPRTAKELHGPRKPQNSLGIERSSQNMLQTRLSRHYVILQ